MGQEGVLLALVEPVDLVDKQQGVPALGLLPVACPLDHGADFLHAAEHRRDGLETQVADISQQLGKGGFTNPWGAPEDHRVKLPLLNSPAKRLARADQVSLPNIVVQGGRPHPCSERPKTGGFREQAVLHQAPSRMISTPSG